MILEDSTTDAFLKRKFGSNKIEARVAEVIFILAACILPALISCWLITMQLTLWQFVVSAVATASLGFHLLALGFLLRVLRQRK